MTAPAATASSAVAAQAAQTGLVVALAADLERAWPRLDIADLRTSLPQFQLLIAALTRKYGAAAATLAARYYSAERATQGVRGSFTVSPAATASVAQVGQGVDWAVQPLWAAEPDIQTAQTNLAGVAEKLVLDTGRDTIIQNAAKDPKSRGWARIPEANPCAFCALLAIRGAIYTGQTGDFKSHDHCRCHVEPIFGRYEPSAQIREWQRLYQDSTTGGNAARTRREWRRAFEQHQQ